MVPLTPDVVRTDLEVLRGPLALSHDGEVSRGVVGGLVRDRKRVVAALGVLATLVLGGASGTLWAVRDHWVQQGRDLERARVEAEEVQRLEARVQLLEVTCVRRTTFSPLPAVDEP